MAITLKHQTIEQFLVRFWQTVRTTHMGGDRLKFHYLIWWIWNRNQIGDFTSAQIRTAYNTAFGKSLTVAQWNDLVTTRLVPIKDRYLATMAETEV